ncbi:SRPBCC family protein [Pseudomonas sp. NPDC090592]|uniref:aromatic ring-hydroxylating oxygenase subunit alpha n=1 Tax=Pseudomonas sp. NPDC090592 TaxID=3364480 RepID=UPI00383AD7E4
MATVFPKSHKDLLQERQPGFSMPSELYGRQDVLDNDIEVIFHQHWIMVGVAADVPEPGDVYAVDIGRSSVLLVHDDDGVIRAFRNVCRHRGSRLKDPGKSTVGMLVCPYHQWTYDLDGALKHAGHMGADFDRSCRSLMPVHVRDIAGVLFVCLSDNPPMDIARLEQEMTARWAPYDLRNTRIAYESDIIEAGNWKLVIENNRECYHCAGGHPELLVSLSSADLGYSAEEMTAHERAQVDAFEALSERQRASWDADGIIHHVVDEMADENPTMFRAQRQVIIGAGESQTMTTHVACHKLLGGGARRDLGSSHLWTHHSWTHVMSDHAVVTYCIPLTPDTTLVRSKWLVRADAVEGVDYDLEQLTEVWKATNAADARFVAINHCGTQDPGYVPGPYSRYTEVFLERFASWYSARLAAHGVR